MNLSEILSKLPDTKGIVVILSGGMDSTIATRLCVEKYGKENVRALTFYYGQKQAEEIIRARSSTGMMGIEHKVLYLEALGKIGQGFSANLDKNIDMPTIKDILGDPRPKTYVPNRNMILMSIAAAYAEVHDIDTVIMGLQIHDEYGYHDTTQRFVNKINSVLSENRIIKVQIIAPFAALTKTEEIKLLQELDGNVDLLYYTLTCYNPDHLGNSCGECPSCSERIRAFMNNGLKDPIPYKKNIKWV